MYLFSYVIIIRNLSKQNKKYIFIVEVFLLKNTTNLTWSNSSYHFSTQFLVSKLHWRNLLSVKSDCSSLQPKSVCISCDNYACRRKWETWSWCFHHFASVTPHLEIIAPLWNNYPISKKNFALLWNKSQRSHHFEIKGCPGCRFLK